MIFQFYRCVSEERTGLDKSFSIWYIPVCTFKYSTRSNFRFENWTLAIYTWQHTIFTFFNDVSCFGRRFFFLSFFEVKVFHEKSFKSIKNQWFKSCKWSKWSDRNDLYIQLIHLAVYGFESINSCHKTSTLIRFLNSLGEYNELWHIYPETVNSIT